jgi:hypothetical protein
MHYLSKIKEGHLYIGFSNPKNDTPSIMKLTSAKTLCIAAITLASATGAFGECKGEKIDPSWNRNDNKPGSACHKQVAVVRKLEFDPKFECDKQIRLKWQREFKIAEQMGCKL